MKKLLNVFRSRWFIAVLAVLLAVLFALSVVKGGSEECYVQYDWRQYDSFRNGLPDYGIRNRKNLMPPT